MTATIAQQTAKDFASNQEVRWCPGCGDYAILKSVQRTLPQLGARRENTVFVSGIGCAARFPYYLSTYGFHTIHGRGPAIATGTKLANPELDVWLVTGDGDALSIGGNHLIHVLRRNVDIQILLFNNEIYGLTKGQYSPTSRRGTRSPSTPKGSVEAPLSAATLALGAGGRFFARTVDTQQKQMPDVLKRAYSHAGTSLVEILQNCIVFNDKVFSHITDKHVADERQIHVEHGKPLMFGSEERHGLRIRPGTLQIEVVTVGVDGVTQDDILLHNETDRTLAFLLVAMEPPALPVALGVIYCDPAPTYGESIRSQAQDSPEGMSLHALLRSGRTWTVAG